MFIHPKKKRLFLIIKNQMTVNLTKTSFFSISIMKMIKNFSIFAGVGGITMADYPDLDDEDAETVTSEDRLLYFCGINLF